MKDIKSILLFFLSPVFDLSFLNYSLVLHMFSISDWDKHSAYNIDYSVCRIWYNEIFFTEKKGYHDNIKSTFSKFL